MALHVFIRDDVSEEAWAHCGQVNRKSTNKAIMQFIANVMDAAEETHISISIEEVSDEDIVKLPEL